MYICPVYGFRGFIFPDHFKCLFPEKNQYDFFKHKINAISKKKKKYRFSGT